ncbi:hypothetical protein MKZ38_008518 [Zalerion maritima]|uniref:Uncharacterized protein n=1 Tax=Zalerion maritima TaxID=339359 RepID=A0AAD5RHU3_9PEZI|nr:hypothetical protein MKZ38_008518 [Zalerion maritima]
MYHLMHHEDLESIRFFIRFIVTANYLIYYALALLALYPTERSSFGRVLVILIKYAIYICRWLYGDFVIGMSIASNP